MNQLEKEILKYQKRGFTLRTSKSLKYGSKNVLVKKGGLFENDEGIYIYYVDGNANDEAIREFFKDYSKFWEDDADRGYFISTGQVDEKRFKELRILAVDDENIRGSIKLLVAGKSIENEKEQTKKEDEKESRDKTIQLPLSNDIFIVHGKDHSTMKDLKVVLFELGLNPKVLHEQASGSRTIIEQLEKCSNVGYAFVILTPDDVGMERSLFEKVIAKPAELQKMGLCYRARQNVILEFGYFMGLLSRKRVCCLYKGDVELPSDMHGIHYLQFENSIDEIRSTIMKELKEVGYELKI